MSSNTIYHMVADTVEIYDKILKYVLWQPFVFSKTLKNGVKKKSQPGHLTQQSWVRLPPAGQTLLEEKFALLWKGSKVLT